MASSHGVVVESVKVSVLLYTPVRSASVALIACLKAIVTASLDTGPVQADLLKETWSGSGSEKVAVGEAAGV